MKKELKILCKNCDAKHYVKQEQIRIVPVGYKGKVKCYITCSICKKEIIIPSNVVDKKRINKVLDES